MSRLQDTLGNSLGPEGWSTEIEEAWQDTYNFTAEVFSRIITAGNANLVSRALAAGSIDALQHALEQAPRGHRAYSAVVIEADEATISPIIWTIRDGKLDFAEVLLRDILTIRGDRSHYYYGRDVLWENHPELLHLLVEKAPKLLKTVLDGHLWTSKFLEDGKRRVNYYIRDLYGDPNVPEMNSVGSTMLGLFVYRLPMNELHLFSHPLTTFLVDLKWRLFARRSFITMQALNVCNLLFAMAYLEV